MWAISTAFRDNTSISRMMTSNIFKMVSGDHLELSTHNKDRGEWIFWVKQWLHSQSRWTWFSLLFYSTTYTYYIEIFIWCVVYELKLYFLSWQVWAYKVIMGFSESRAGHNRSDTLWVPLTMDFSGSGSNLTDRCYLLLWKPSLGSKPRPSMQPTSPKPGKTLLLSHVSCILQSGTESVFLILYFRPVFITEHWGDVTIVKIFVNMTGWKHMFHSLMKLKLMGFFHWWCWVDSLLSFGAVKTVILLPYPISFPWSNGVYLWQED